MEVYKDRATRRMRYATKKKTQKHLTEKDSHRSWRIFLPNMNCVQLTAISMKPYSPCPGLGISAGILESMVAHHFLTYLNVLTVRGDE